MLRRSSITIVILVAVLLTANHAAFAQKTVRLSATPSAFRVFYKKFANVVNRGVGTEIAAMTSFPFKYGFDAGDEGTWTRSQFLKNYGNIFMPQPIVFKRKDPLFTVASGAYTLENSDDASYFIFKKRGGTYKLVSYMVEP